MYSIYIQNVTLTPFRVIVVVHKIPSVGGKFGKPLEYFKENLCKLYGHTFWFKNIPTALPTMLHLNLN